MKKYRNANIEVVLNGFIINIGCSKVVAESPESLIKLITQYLKDPTGTEKKLSENSFRFSDLNGLISASQTTAVTSNGVTSWGNLTTSPAVTAYGQV